MAYIEKFLEVTNQNHEQTVVNEAKEWYKKFTGMPYSSNDTKELVEIYQTLEKTT